MAIASPPPNDQWLEDQLDACTRMWPEHTNFRIQKSGPDWPLFVYGDAKDPAKGSATVLVSIDHPEAWSLLAGMLWGS